MQMLSNKRIGSVALLALLVMAACGGPKTTNLTPDPSKEIKAPAWFLSPPTDPSYLFAATTMTSRDMQMAIQKAETQARTNLAQQMESKVANLTKQFQEEVGADGDSELLQQFTSCSFGRERARVRERYIPGFCFDELTHRRGQSAVDGKDQGQSGALYSLSGNQRV